MTGAASFEFELSIAGSPATVSNRSTATVNISETDSAPVATDFSVTMVDHDPVDITLSLGSEYTDVESDKATAFNDQSVVGGTVTSSTCDAAGTCTVTFDPDIGFAGDATINYTITALQQSNEGVIRIFVPNDSALSFHLDWSTLPSPVVDQQCRISLPGVIDNQGGSFDCGTSACFSFTGTLDSSVTSSVVSADNLGITGVLDEFGASVSPELAGLSGGQSTKVLDFRSGWRITNSSEAVNLERILSLNAAVPDQLTYPTVAVTPTTEVAMAGLQLPIAGCTGNSCIATAPGSIAAGDGFGCSVMPDSRIQCWGDNTKGKLGHNDTVEANDAATPVAVRDPNTLGNFAMYGFKAVTAGTNHACGLSFAGAVFCWGDNASGQLGNNGAVQTGTYFAYAQQVKVDASNSLTGIVAIDAGRNHTCAVDNSKNLWCWGDNSSGQLGDASVTTNSPVAVKVKKVTTKTGDTVNTTADLDNIVSVSAGGDATCAVRIGFAGPTVTSQTALCWGDNSQRNAGDGNYHDADETLLTKVGTGTGYGIEDDRLYPVTVRSDGAGTALADVEAVSVGEGFSCALLSNGKVKCWGSNTDGRLGINNGDTALKEGTPTTVQDTTGLADLTDAAHVSAGSAHACVLKRDQSVVCWGDNTTGQLGDEGLGTDASYAVQVIDGSSAGSFDDGWALVTGSDHTCALTSGGGIRCWGDNTDGELGVNNGAVTNADSATTGVIQSGSVLFNGAFQTCSAVYDIGLP